MTTVEIPLDPVTARGLHGPKQRLGLIALAALQSCQSRDEREQDLPALPVESEQPVDAEAGVLSLPAMMEAEEIEAVDWPDMKTDPAAPTDEPTFSNPASITVAHASGDGSSAPSPVPAAPPPIRAGDVYIAHYYARLPGDGNRNLYTRLGGPAPHA